MAESELILDGFDRVRGLVRHAVEDLTPAQLCYRPVPDANSIGWLVWHLTRVQDDHLAAAADTAQVWTTDGFAARFALPYDESATGYGHSSLDVARFQVADASLLIDYYDAVHARTVRFIAGLEQADYDRVVDDSYDPPVTVGVRLVSVLSDDLQHVGQAAYVRGLLPTG